MRYIPNTEKQKEEMLKEIGVSSFNDLLKDIPESILLEEFLKIPGPFSEQEIKEKIYQISKKNADFFFKKPLIGAGAYRHFIPAAVKSIISREEFYTSYTPYQPEISQGNLQSMFEYQTHLSRLTKMDVVVPSIYDGASATAEAVLMAMRLTRKNRIVISSLVHPQYIETVKTYTEPHHTEIIAVSYENGLTDFDEFKNKLTDDTAAFVIQSPNFLGGIENIEKFVKYAHDQNVLVIQVIAESLSLGILKSPGEANVDIVAGEAQSFGMDLNFGGPYNGYLASKMKYIRQIPGRIAGETTDKNGNRGFVMTFRAREQDIRREKATSNICSNHALNIVAGNVYLSLLGKEGIKSLSALNMKSAHYLKNKLLQTKNFTEIDYPFFNEFYLKARDKNKTIETLEKHGFIPPLDLSKFYPELEDYLLFAVTEIFNKEELDLIADLLSR